MAQAAQQGFPQRFFGGYKRSLVNILGLVIIVVPFCGCLSRTKKPNLVFSDRAGRAHTHTDIQKYTFGPQEILAHLTLASPSLAPKTYQRHSARFRLVVALSGCDNILLCGFYRNLFSCTECGHAVCGLVRAKVLLLVGKRDGMLCVCEPTRFKNDPMQEKENSRPSESCTGPIL